MSNQPPVDEKGLRRNHWDKYNPVNASLAEIVDRLANDLVSAIAEPGESERYREDSCNTYTLPHGRMSKLPPALFGTITKDTVSLDRNLIVPEDDREIESMVAGYYDWVTRLAQTGEYNYVSIPSRDVLVEEMKKLKGQMYPEDQWEESASVTRSALNQEPSYTIDIHRVTQINGGAYELEQLPPSLRSSYKQHSEYILAVSQLVPGDGRVPSVRELVQLPIGEYGAEPAERLARAVVTIGDFIRTSEFMDSSIAVLASEEDANSVLRKHTMRTRESYDRGDLAYIKNGVSDALIGGILSMAQVISFLTSEKVPGYDNYDELVADILDSDTLEHFARIAPVGYIGPVTLAGIYIPNALNTSNNQLSLSDEIKKPLGEMRRKYFEGMAARWALYDEVPLKHDMPRTLGLTCPASDPKGAIATLRPVLKAFLNR